MIVGTNTNPAEETTAHYDPRQRIECIKYRQGSLAPCITNRPHPPQPPPTELEATFLKPNQKRKKNPPQISKVRAWI